MKVAEQGPHMKTKEKGHHMKIENQDHNMKIRKKDHRQSHMKTGNLSLTMMITSPLSHQKEGMVFKHQDEQIFEPKIVNIFLYVSFNICFGCSKEPSH